MKFLQKFILVVFIVTVNFILIHAADQNVGTPSDFTILPIGPLEPPIVGAECDFSDDSGLILRGNGGTNFWMKINGQMIEFKGERSYDESAKDLEMKRWHQKFSGSGITLTLDLIRTREGEDSVAMEGKLILIKGKLLKKIKVKGGCGA